MKKLPSLLGAAALMVVIGLVYGLTVYLTPKDTNATTATCQKIGPIHTVIIKNDAVAPVRTVAALCDRLTITNEDDTARLMAFGTHDHHQPYDDVTEKMLKKTQSLTVTLDKTGTYKFHDHLHDELQGEFTVVR